MGLFTRRHCLLGAGAWAALAQLPAQAGAQIEEPLIDSVRSALQAAVNELSPPEPIFASTDSRLQYLRWLTATSDKLRKRMPDWEVRRDFLQTLWYEATRAGLEVSLVLGLIQVESGFNKYAISPAGARGLMQVMPFWVRQIGSREHSLFDLTTNLRYGCTILRHYLDRERGDLFRALGRYNGSLGKAEYPDMVLGAWRRHWDYSPPPRRARRAGP